VPLLELIVEVLLHNMACNTCEGHRAIAPGIEAEVKFVVFDPLDAANSFLPTIRVTSYLFSSPVRMVSRLTAWAWPPKWFATAFAIEGFSATHNTRVIPSKCQYMHVKTKILPSGKAHG